MNMIHTCKSIVLATILASGLQTAIAQAEEDTLYKSLGGKSGVNRIVNEFIAIIVADPRIDNFFKTTDTERLSALLIDQFCQLSGGPCVYQGRDMDSAHEGLKIRSSDFYAVTEDLQIAMENCQIPSYTANKLIAKLASMKRVIVKK
ncbi:group I truncated hemoglobin [Undibacterium sp. Ji42W]|uniref:group I truncated hemoglobin n=1 Tax=Undibacterium sp. Ji42W TaxID=3413039 RepID=UPI003BF37CCA